VERNEAPYQSSKLGCDKWQDRNKCPEVDLVELMLVGCAPWSSEMFGIVRMTDRQIRVGRTGTRQAGLRLGLRGLIRLGVMAGPTGLSRAGLAPVRRQMRVVMPRG